jgi:hypothetical protein
MCLDKLFATASYVTYPGPAITAGTPVQVMPYNPKRIGISIAHSVFVGQTILLIASPPGVTPPANNGWANCPLTVDNWPFTVRDFGLLLIQQALWLNASANVTTGQYSVTEIVANIDPNLYVVGVK